MRCVKYGASSSSASLRQTPASVSMTCFFEGSHSPAVYFFIWIASSYDHTLDPSLDDSISARRRLAVMDARFKSRVKSRASGFLPSFTKCHLLGMRAFRTLGCALKHRAVCSDYHASHPRARRSEVAHCLGKFQSTPHVRHVCRLERRRCMCQSCCDVGGTDFRRIARYAQCSVGWLAKRRKAWGSTSSTASRHSLAPLVEPGVLRIKVVPQVPATPRESRPSGLTKRIASLSPGACRSSTASVPSGVKSRGVKPVPPVVTIRPAKFAAIWLKALDTDSVPSSVT